MSKRLTRNHTRASGTASIDISRLQREFLAAALAELSAAGHALGDCQLTATRIRNVSPDDAALFLVYIQNRHEAWLGNEVSSTSRIGAGKSIRGLVAKLLSIARDQVLILLRENEHRTYGGDDAAVILRLSPAMLKSISELAGLASRHSLAYTVRPLDSIDHSYRVRYMLPPDAHDFGFKSDLCVSTNELWVRSRLPPSWSWVPEETVRVPLARILPVMDLPDDIELPPLIDEAHIAPYRDRLRALEAEADTLDALQRAFYNVELAVPADVTTMAERLWFEDGETPFTDAREAARMMDGRLESWERSIQNEREALCRDVLGVRIGDDVLVSEREKPVRLRIDQLFVHASESGIYFTIHGRRFRKDGVLGKRSDTVTLRVRDSSR